MAEKWQQDCKKRRWKTKQGGVTFKKVILFQWVMIATSKVTKGVGNGTKHAPYCA
jgi:hypothetical protein